MKTALLKFALLIFLFADLEFFQNRLDPVFVPDPRITGTLGDAKAPVRKAENIVCRINGSPQILIPPNAPSSHSASLVKLSDGRLMSVWYAGSREGAKDVQIMASTSDNQNNWRTPEILFDRQTIQQQTKRSIRKLGNPLLFVNSDGRLHIFIVSVSFGGWSGSSLNHSCSDDNGRTWTQFQRLKLSPLFNLSNLVRSSAVPMSEQCTGIPLYHEMVQKYSQFLVLDRTGKIIRRSEIPAVEDALQPTVAPFDSKSALALMRNGMKNGSEKILAAQTKDAGRSWQIIPDFPLPNYNAGIALVRSRDGILFLAANSTKKRNVLDLYAASENDPAHWTRLFQLENSPKGEFSYPTLLLEDDNKISLVYTWKRSGIKFCCFDLIDSRKSKEEEEKK